MIRTRLSTAAHDVLDQLAGQPLRRDALTAAGIPRRALTELIGAGLVKAPLYGVVVRSDTPDTTEVRAAAARLVLPDGAALCRATAAWLIGIDARPPGTHHDPPPLECAVPRGATPLRRPGLRCYVTDLLPADVTEAMGLPCTTVDRTAIDLARWLSPGMGLAVLDALARRRLIVPVELLDALPRWAGTRFVEQARRLVSLCDPASESYGESWLRLRFHDAGFPPPELQISLVDGNGVERRRLDLGYRSWRYAWEYDGEEFHDGLQAEAADRRRRAQIEREWGWTVVGVGKNLVLGPSMALERGIAEIVHVQPLIRRRAW